MLMATEVKTIKATLRLYRRAARLFFTRCDDRFLITRLKSVTDIQKSVR